MQKSSDNKVPGSNKYNLPFDPCRKMYKNQRPLSSKLTFINTKASSYHGMAGSTVRQTIFSGKFNMFDNGIFTKDLSNAGGKLGPGPNINVRDFSQDKKPSSKKTTMNQDQRRLGNTNQKPGHPGPTDYRLKKAMKT